MPMYKFHCVHCDRTLDLFDDEVEPLEDGFRKRDGSDSECLWLKESPKTITTVGTSIGYRHMYPIYDSAHLSKKVSDEHARKKDQEDNLNRFQKSTFQRL